MFAMWMPVYSADSYKNFNVAIYTRVYEVNKMEDRDWLKKNFDIIQKNLKVDKVYLETHRDWIVADQDNITWLKKFFKDRGVKTSGGITITVNERNRFQTYCYSNPEHRAKLKQVIEFTAKNFDEIILDDFFFTSCKCEKCIEAKGDQSWTDFRLKLMTDAARDLILEPARAVNPNVKVTIKYPNWYEHFQGCGFNLETEPKMFDGVYTGTETRDPSSNQHLQAYEGYLIFRYLESLKPGHNGGGWVDTGGMGYLDRYAEQLWITLFAKAPEVTLFDFRQAIMPLNKRMRADWQGQGTTFDYDTMIAPVSNADGSYTEDATIAYAAGYTFDVADKFMGKLGEPVAVHSYKPFHSVGEDFLQNYLGMIGIPMHLVSEYPADDKVILLTETASFDPDIVKKIESSLHKGNSVVITSGLLRKLQNNGLDDIVELRYTDRKAIVDKFRAGWGPLYEAKQPMLIPQINYITNDSWELISGLDETNGWPLLHMADYATGHLYVLTIPENFVDLYNLPDQVLNSLRSTITSELPIHLEGPGQIALYLYDNDTFIVESLLDESADVSVVMANTYKGVENILTGEKIEGKPIQGFFNQPSTETRYPFTIKPHSFVVMKFK